MTAHAFRGRAPGSIVRPRLRRGILTACGPLLAAAALTACGASPAAEPAGDAPETALVERRTLEIRAEAAGQIEPIRVVEVKSKASGEVLRLHVETGDRVDRGALLAEVDPRDVRNALAQAEADLEVARARLATAEAQRRRSEELRQANVITEQELEQAGLDLANARSQFIKAQTNLELARERMSDVTIRAPLDGTIIQKNVEIGQIIQSASQNISGGTTLFLMADLSAMQVRTLVDETDIGRVQPGQTARVGVEAYPDRTFVGRVLKIEPQAVVEQNVTMFPVLVRLDNPDGLLKPGMNAEVQIEIARRDDALTVPNAAVVAMRDAAAAGEVLGLDPDELRAALRGSRGGFGGGRDGAAGGSGGTGPRPGGDDGGAPAGSSGRGAARDGGAPAAADAATSPRPGAAASPAAAKDAPDADECRALLRRARTEGREALSEADRAKARDCFRRLRASGGGPGAGGSTGASGRGSGDVRPGVVFVQGENGPEPRMVLLGLNDWDHTEIVRGLDEGERVILMSVARLQAAQQQMMDRIRQRMGGPIPGAGRRR